MSTFITKSTNSTTGYEIVIKDEKGAIVETKAIESIVDEGKTLKLPENPSNRKFYSLKKVEEANGTVELTYKDSIKLGERSSTSTSSKLDDYMTEEEKQIIADIKAKAEARREQAKKDAADKKNDPVEKARKRVASAIENLKALGLSDESIAKLIANRGEQA